MPVKVAKLPSGSYKVSTPGGVKAKGTTKEKAMKQKRLLYAIENDPDFVVRGKGKRAKSKIALPRH